MKKIVYAFIGRRGSGKDTAADYMTSVFKEVHTRETVTISRFAFADSLKDIVHSTLLISMEQSEFLKRNPDIKIVNGMDLRRFYNHFGDILKTKVNPNIFTENTLGNMQESLVDGTQLFLITDLRYPLEKEALIDFGIANDIEVVFIKMLNTKLFGVAREHDEHESESLSDEIHGDILLKAKDPEEIELKIKAIYNATTI